MSGGSWIERYRTLIIFVVSTAVALWLLYVLRSAMFPFILGVVVAYLLLPIVIWTERILPPRGGWFKSKRILSIALVFIVIFGVIGFLSYFVITDIINVFSYLLEHAPQFIAKALATLREWATIFREHFPTEMQQEVDRAVLSAGTAIANAVRDMVTRGVSFIPGTVGLVFGFLLSPFFVFFVLRDYEGLRDAFRSTASPWIGHHIFHVVEILDRVLGRYIRTQLMLGWVVAYFCFVGLLMLQVPAAAALAAFAGVMELVPLVGPWIALAMATVVALASVPEKAIWVAILFFVVQQTENLILAPRVQRDQMQMHPSIMLVLLVLGVRFAGFWGLFIAVPLAAILVELYRYVRDAAAIIGVQEAAQHSRSHTPRRDLSHERWHSSSK